jgi:DNA-binding HxlR family transcriptional regulator
MAPRTPSFARSPCPIAATLDLVGDRWTLLIIRDLINGKRHYGEFMDSPEGISSNILADRLARLSDDGFVRKRPCLGRARYEYVLTQKGSDLHPILQAICRWGNAHVPGSWVPPSSFMTSNRTPSVPGLASVPGLEKLGS